MKNKKWVRYFIYIFLVYTLIAWRNNVLVAIVERRSITYDPQILYSIALAICFYGGIGLVLGLEHFILEMKKNGVWKVDWAKLLIMGLPTLLLSFSVFIYGFGSGIIWKIPLHFMDRMVVDYWDIIYLFSLILGYTIITSVYKRDVD